MKNKIEDSTFRVGLVGNFQEGKSTLINCLLEDRVAITGAGVSTTKQVVRYRYAKYAQLAVMSMGRKTLVPISKFECVSKQAKVSNIEVCLPHTMLQQVELWDTPGFNAEENDDALTDEYLAQLDAVIFVASGERQLSQQQCELLRKIHHDVQLPFIILMNCRQLSGVTDESGRKISLEEYIRKMADETWCPLLSNNGIPYSCISDRIFPINLLDCWNEVLKTRKSFTLSQTDGEKKKIEALDNNQFYLERHSKDALVQKDIEYERHLCNNLSVIRDFLINDSITFNNFHVLAQFHNCLVGLKEAFIAI